jgi:hypothetical protein
MQKNPERVAWIVMLGAFAVFLMLCAAIPFGARYYLLYTTSTKPALLEVVGGTISVQERGSVAPIAVTRSKELNEGSVIETNVNSRGFLTLLDGSTITLFPDTLISIPSMRVPAFSWGQSPIVIELEQTRGRIRIGAAQLFGGNTRDREFQISTPHLLAKVRGESSGSYAIDVSTDSSQVTVRDGSAQVSAQGRTVTINRGQRTVVTSGEPPLPALPAALDLIVNGDFKDPRSRGWNDTIEIPSTPSSPSGSISNITLDNRVATRIRRSGSNQSSAISGIVQQLNKDVSDYRTLRLTADVRVHSQSLSGGGILSSEYPLIIRLRYRDANGSDAEWVHGFYIQNTTNNPTNNGELITSDVWFPFESGNLFDTLDPKPFYLISLQFYASGWDYESYVSGIRFIVE